MECPDRLHCMNVRAEVTVHFPSNGDCRSPVMCESCQCAAMMMMMIMMDFSNHSNYLNVSQQQQVHEVTNLLSDSRNELNVFHVCPIVQSIHFRQILVR